MTLNRIFARFALALAVIANFAPMNLAQKKQLHVAAAADLQTVMPEIAKAFEAQTGTSVDVVYGSSGNFYAQIRNGAPLDVFFSADSEYPRKLEEAGFAEPRSAVIYGLGRIVLWMPANAGCNPESEGWKCLVNPEVRKIAIANPGHAPYGRAAVAALRKAGIYNEI